MQLCHTVARAGAVALLFVGMLALPPTGAAERAPRSRESRIISLSGDYDSVVFDVRSRGCFAGTRRRYTFVCTPTPRLLIKDYPSAPWPGGPRREEAVPLATVTLTRAQVARLENLLRFYQRRERSRNWCTSVEHVDLAAYRNGRKVRSAYVVDDTGEYFELADAHPDDIAVLEEQQRVARGSSPVLYLNQAHYLAAEATENGRRLVPYCDVPREETLASQTLRSLCVMKTSEPTRVPAER